MSNLNSLLGIKTNIPKVSIWEYSGLFFAESKFGKTQLVSLLPKCTLVAFEKGYDAQVVDYKDCTGADAWEKFIEFVDLLEENREVIGNDLKLIAIDTLEEAYRACEPYMLRKESIKDGERYVNIGDIPYGNGYSRKDEYFRKQFKRLYALGLKPIYLTHVKVKTIKPKDKSQEPYDTYVPTVPDRCLEIIYPEVSYIIRGHREVIDGERTRVLQIQGTENATTGSRVYIEGNIPFKHELEAIEKLEIQFKQAIQKKLIEKGIKDDVDELEVKQDAEKLVEVKETLKKINELPNVIKEIKETMKLMLSNKTITNTQLLKILKENKVDSPDNINDIDIANNILTTLQKTNEEKS